MRTYRRCAVVSYSLYCTPDVINHLIYVGGGGVAQHVVDSRIPRGGFRGKARLPRPGLAVNKYEAKMKEIRLRGSF